ncbi:MAG: radical SAM protein [Spirochaetales bacterium]|nr:radical SAM protein [Spirochaetales bacterium]MCF7937929.1 radical SAM protein [Spirochaetales bacterium]
MRPDRSPVIGRQLFSGGLISNYYCSSSCRHCLYCSGPGWNKDYINEETTERIIDTASRAGARSMHIGGGEPLLLPDRLSVVARVFRRRQMGIDYVETNSSWVTNAERVREVLGLLLESGVSTLLLSISPFHNEYIPYDKVKTLRRVAGEMGMGIFPWLDGFTTDLEKLDTSRRHSIDEMEEHFGPGYLSRIPERYWVTLRGRALVTYRPFLSEQPVESFLDGGGPGPCRELEDTSHFHLDLFGNYLPGLCPGLALPAEEIGRPISSDKYPYLYLLLTQGVAGLYRLAQESYGFIPRHADFQADSPDQREYAGYVSKCELCQEIRAFLVLDAGVESPDLSPRQFYEQYRDALGKGTAPPWLETETPATKTQRAQRLKNDGKTLS